MISLNEIDTCVICLTDFCFCIELNVCKTICNHRFHLACMMKIKSNTCPTCRTVLYEIQPINENYGELFTDYGDIIEDEDEGIITSPGVSDNDYYGEIITLDAPAYGAELQMYSEILGSYCGENNILYFYEEIMSILENINENTVSRFAQAVHDFDQSSPIDTQLVRILLCIKNIVGNIINQI